MARPDAPATLPPPSGLTEDQVVDPGVDYTPRPPQGRSDDYHCFVIDPGLTEDRALVAYEILPGVKHEVHHVALFAAPMASAAASDAVEAGPGWTCFGGGGAGSSIVGSWVPGSPVTRHPDNTGVRLRAGDAIIMQVHYNTSSGPLVPDRTRLKLKYGAAATTRQAAVLGFANTSFTIPPNTLGYSITHTTSLPAGGRLYGVQPHMHLLGKRIRMELLAGGATTCLVDVPAWQFHWQQMYFYDTAGGISLPSGAQLRITCTWDNPGTQTVRFGEGTAEEMCGGGLFVAAP